VIDGAERSADISDMRGIEMGAPVRRWFCAEQGVPDDCFFNAGVHYCVPGKCALHG
jgi:hypothetical protein